MKIRATVGRIWSNFKHLVLGFGGAAAREDTRPTGVGLDFDFGLIVGLRDIDAVEFIPPEFDVAAAVVGVLNAGEVAGELFQLGVVCGGVFKGCEVFEGFADADQEKSAHGFEAVGFVVVFEFEFVFGEVIIPFHIVLVLEPILVTGGAPFGKVLVGDGLAVEELGEDGFGFGQIVNPGEDGAAELAFLKAVV